MDKQLTAGQALARAAHWLARVEDDEDAVDREDGRDAVALAHAYATYALAITAWDGTLDVRAHVESGI